MSDKSIRRAYKPAPLHNYLYDGAPGMCLCWYCCKAILAIRCPFRWEAFTTESGQQYPAGRCGDYRGHREGHTILVATTFLMCEERVRLDAPPGTMVAP